MKRRVVFLMAILASAFGPVCAAAENNAPILGVWRATGAGLPSVTLTITDEGGRLAGAILFYLIIQDPGKAPTASPGLPEPLFNLKFDGKTLTFQVSHRRAHPPRTLSDPPVTIRLKVTAPDKGVLIREREEDSKLQVTRNEY
jgi:hypothetical protein